MKKTILVLLIAVMTATPCLAQEIHPDGIFSIEGTLWESLPIGLYIFPYPWLTSDVECRVGFYGGGVYLCSSPCSYLGSSPSSFYVDILGCSVFYIEGGVHSSLGQLPSYFGIFQPIGIGMVVKSAFRDGPPDLFPYIPNLFPSISIALLIKTEDNWKPPEFVSISPNQGEQGAILKDVTIRGLNTYFASGDTAVTFGPAKYGEIISNIRPISDTEIKFDLELEADAPIGFRDVDITWDGVHGKVHVGEFDAFEVLPRSN